jgi:hypothetical protein
MELIEMEAPPPVALYSNHGTVLLMVVKTGDKAGQGGTHLQS